MVLRETILKVNLAFFSREDFVSLKQLTTFSMDGCEVEDQLELGFNLFTANSDLQVMCFLCHDFRIEFYRFWSFAALPSPSIQISPFLTSPS